MQRISVFILLLFIVAPLWAFNIDVGLFTNQNIKSFFVSIDTGRYELFEKDYKLLNVKKGDKLMFRYKTDNSLDFYLNNALIGSAKEMELRPLDSVAVFKIQSLAPKNEVHTFDDGVRIVLWGGYLQAINRVNIDKYICGVLEAEVGKFKNVEFLKSQALITRSYAVRQMYNTKSTLPYHICDNTSCQVYSGKNRFNDSIAPAVYATSGLILIDSTQNIIDAVFHANSGGITINSEDVWSKPLPYLKAVVDTFSLLSTNACWTAEIKKEAFVRAHPTYLDTAYNKCIKMDSLGKVLDLCPASMLDKNEMRKKWGLRSTQFSMQVKDGMVYLTGYGHGHRVGLSQEGAFEMARLGYTYQQIIAHYYVGVQIVQYEVWKN